MAKTETEQRLEELKEETKALYLLLEENEVGLMMWNTAVRERIKRVYGAMEALGFKPDKAA